MISPREERETQFWSGTREYDPVDLGYRNLDVPGAVLFRTSVTGNDNVGHEFRDGCQKNGVIGPFLPPEQRRQVLEYLKVMDYVADGGFEPGLCKEPDPAVAKPASAVTALCEFPRWGTGEFRHWAWKPLQRRCHGLRDELPPAPEPTTNGNLGARGEPHLFEMYRIPRVCSVAARPWAVVALLLLAGGCGLRSNVGEESTRTAHTCRASSRRRAGWWTRCRSSQVRSCAAMRTPRRTVPDRDVPAA
jgi:hypothetical protein